MLQHLTANCQTLHVIKMYKMCRYHLHYDSMTIDKSEIPTCPEIKLFTLSYKLCKDARLGVLGVRTTVMLFII